MNHLSEKNIQNPIGEEDSVDLKKIFNKFVNKWQWFVVSVITCLLLAFLFARYTPPKYQINAKLLVNDDNKGGGLGNQAGSLMDLGGVLGGKSSVDNEVEILKTRYLMEQVVREMQLNIQYFRKTGVISHEFENPSFKLNILNSVDTIETTDIDIEVLANGRLSLDTKGIDRELNWGESVKVEGLGTVALIPNIGMKVVAGKYSAQVTSIDQRVAQFQKDLTVVITNKQVTIIDLGLAYSLQSKGESILRSLIDKYTQSNLKDKNAIADSTYKFIRERIDIIAGELGDVENKVERFKQDNRLADMSEQSKLLVQNTGAFSNELAKAETQVTVLNDLENYLRDESKNKRVFPSSLLPSDMVFSGLMAQYNGLLIERDKQLLSVTESSPFIKNIDDQIDGLRKGILANISSTKNTYVVTRNKLRDQLKSAESNIGGVPQIEKNYLKLARNQQIKQELYIFLMQKAEETAISKTSNISIAKVIDPPKADFRPISPKKSVVYLIGLLSGIVFPVILIVIIDLFNTTITTKEEITNATNVPVVGELSHNVGMDNLIVANHGRSALSEQFRALRTNLSFYLKKKDEKVILLTSSMSGEGKSFTAINLGNILALAGKKVLLMELDLRKPGLSSKLNISNNLGFSNYTINPNLTSADIINPLKINENLFVISSGPLPPNPAETLMSERTTELMKELKEKFDYILMDAPPIGIITDAQLLSDFADVTLYIVRQNYTQKNQVAIIQDLYRNNRMRNLGIVVNDIISKTYGYGYGYGNYAEEQSENWYTSLIKKLKR